MGYTTTDLLASIRLRTNAPSASSAFPDADILRLANEELQAHLVPLILKHRDEHLVGNVPHDQTIVAGTEGYRLHWRALDQRVREVKIALSTGETRDLAKIDPSQRHAFPVSGSPVGFYVEGNKIVLVPKPDVGGDTLRVRYFKRPGSVVAGSVTVTVINTGTNTITTSGAHGLSAGSSVDFILRRPGFDVLGQDVTVLSAPTATTFTVAAADIPSDLAVGDYVCVADTSPFPQIPEGLHPLLYQRVAVQVLAIMGDKENLKTAAAILEKMEEFSTSFLSDRIGGEPKRVTNPNGLLGPSWRGNGYW